MKRLVTTTALLLVAFILPAPAQAQDVWGWRWDPCAQPITWSVVTNKGDTRTPRTMRRVAAEITTMTDLALAQVPTGGDIVVRYADQSTDPIITPGIDGYELSHVTPDGRWIRAAFITLDTRVRRDRGTGLRLLVVRHEMGHAMGVPHLDDPTAVMNATSLSKQWSDSDRAALMAVGASAGCGKGSVL